jgi:hypothetical protein
MSWVTHSQECTSLGWRFSQNESPHRESAGLKSTAILNISLFESRTGSECELKVIAIQIRIA